MFAAETSLYLEQGFGTPISRDKQGSTPQSRMPAQNVDKTKIYYSVQKAWAY
jgi:hypothetical protein